MISSVKQQNIVRLHARTVTDTTSSECYETPSKSTPHEWRCPSLRHWWKALASSATSRSIIGATRLTRRTVPVCTVDAFCWERQFGESARDRATKATILRRSRGRVHKSAVALEIHIAQKLPFRFKKLHFLLFSCLIKAILEAQKFRLCIRKLVLKCLW